MGLSASQARQLLLTAKRNDLEFRAQQISQQRLVLSSQLEEIATDYENATSNRQMQIRLYTTEGDSQVQDTVNLTYRALVSGCAGITDVDAQKINAKGYDSDGAATTAYILKNASGAIVVSDLSEIPGVSKGTKYYQKYTNFDEAYENAEVKKDSEGNEVRHIYYKNSDDKYVELSLIKDDDGEVIGYQDSETKEEVVPTRFYVDAENEDEYDHQFGELETAVENKQAVAGDSVEMSGRRYEVVKGSGTVKVSREDANGNWIYEAEYVVDPNLARGGTDQYGNSSSTGPNYLQDMLRNGMYSLEKYNKEQDEWNSVSWDSAVGISDRYYTEDDDAAKAKYDRLQNEIQRQDKKLELELDNIETQRSAITTEEESVQKVMDDNIEGTFKTFA